MFLCKGRWMQFVLVMAQWEGLKGTRALGANCECFSVGQSSGSVGDSPRAFPGEQPAVSDSSWENTHCLPGSVLPLIPLGQPLYAARAHTHTHTHTQRQGFNEIHAHLIQMHACHSCMHTYMIMICTWNHTLTYNEKDLKQAMIYHHIFKVC